MAYRLLKALPALALILASTFAQATECMDRYTGTPHVKVYLCQNGSSYEETTFLLIKARAEALNAFIGAGIAAGNITPRVYHLSLYDPVMSFPQLSITRGSRDVYVEAAEFLSLGRMKSLVEYTAGKKFAPVGTPSYPEADYDQGRAACETFFRKHRAAKNEADTPKTVWQQSGLALVYQHDSVCYYAGSKPLPVSHSAQLPFRAGRRNVLFAGDKIVVVEGGRVILSFKTEVPYGDVYNIKKAGSRYLFFRNDACVWQYDYRLNKVVAGSPSQR